jgi:hypothetical protein
MRYWTRVWSGRWATRYCACEAGEVQAEARGQRPEARGQRPEARGQRPEGRRGLQSPGQAGLCLVVVGSVTASQATVCGARQCMGRWCGVPVRRALMFGSGAHCAHRVAAPACSSRARGSRVDELSQAAAGKLPWRVHNAASTSSPMPHAFGDANAAFYVSLQWCMHMYAARLT